MTSNGASQDELVSTQELLDQPLDPDLIKQRQGPNGSSIDYVEGDTVINYANSVFGYNGWSSELLSKDIIIENETSNNNIMICCETKVAVTANGATKQDIGICTSINRAHDKAYSTACKGATTDALKRALRQFGIGLKGKCTDYKNIRKKRKRERSTIKSEPAYADIPARPSTSRLKRRKCNNV